MVGPFRLGVGLEHNAAGEGGEAILYNLTVGFRDFSRSKNSITIPIVVRVIIFVLIVFCSIS